VRALATLGLTALLLTGCGGRTEDVHDAARAWTEAVRASEWSTACALLAPATLDEVESSAQRPCVDALPQEVVPPPQRRGRAQAFGSSAQVSWGSETLYLAEVAGRWRVWAAACTPTAADEPYDCRIAGG